MDTQFDFMYPEGNLYVPDSRNIIPNIKRLIDFASRNKITIISSVDAHTPDDPEFKDFPPHCVINSPGSNKIEGTLTNNNLFITDTEQTYSKNVLKGTQIIIPKNTIDIFHNKNISKIVKLLGINNFVVFGVATEYCVKMAVIGLLQLGCAVFLIEDAINAVKKQNGIDAIAEMKTRGTQVAMTEQILKEIS